MMAGIQNWYEGQMNDLIKGTSKAERLKIIKHHKKTFNDLIKSADFPKHLSSEPLST